MNLGNWAKRHWKTSTLLGLACGIALALLGYRLRHPAAPPPPPSALAEAHDVTQVVRASGLLQPRLKVEVGAQVSGQVRELRVQLGDHVRAGELLVGLDPDMARSDVRQAQAEVLQQQAAIDAREAELRQARRQEQRQRQLLASDSTSASAAEQAQTEVARLDAELRGLRAQRERLQADLEKRRLELGYTEIRAPIAGEVVKIAVEKGQTISALQATPVLLTLAQLDTITVRAKVPEADIQAVRLGQQADFTTLAGDGRHHLGKVRAIEPLPERVDKAAFYNVLFDVDNHDQALLSDMTVQVEITTGKAQRACTVPLLALGARDPDGRYPVQVLLADGSQSTRKLRLGLQDMARAEVLDGLRVGERVVLAPAADTPPAS